MKKQIVVTAALAALVLVGAAQVNPMAQTRSGKVEYIDIRWDGGDRMCVIYPDGRVVFFAAELKDIPRPEDANKRAFYLTIEMNRLAAQGYEFAGGWSDEIIMKRTVPN
jgi:ABC-type sugar transport system substrate-binding protein